LFGASSPPRIRRKNARKSRILTLLALLVKALGFAAWTLRPFFGAPGLPFEIFGDLGGNFYVNVLQSVGQILVSILGAMD